MVFVSLKEKSNLGAFVAVWDLLENIPAYGSTVELGLHEEYIFLKELSRKGAKAQSGYHVFKGFLCAFAPLRETIFPPVVLTRFGLRSQHISSLQVDSPANFATADWEESCIERRPISYRRNKELRTEFMKTFLFVDLSLMAVLIGLTCSPAARSESPVFGVFEGTSPCDAVARKPLQISATVNCEMIKWNLVLFHNPNSRYPAAYELNFNYGVSQPNTNSLKNGGTKVARRGRWTTVQPTTTDPNVVTLELDNGSEGAMSFLMLDHNVLHLLDSDGNLAIGNAGWSYTLSRRNPLQNPANAKATSLQLADVNSLASGATTSSVLGRFVGRSPCVQVARELKMPVAANCRKVKWDLTLYQDSKTRPQNTYELRGTFYRERIRKGTWTVFRGARANPAAIVYQLNGDASHGSLLFLRGDDNILFFLDGDRNLMIGNNDFSYTLNRAK